MIISPSFVRLALVIVCAVVAAACRPAPPAADESAKPAAAQPPASTEAPAPAATEPAANPTPLQDLRAAEILQLNTPWTGDHDRIANGERRFVRALVPFSRTFYYTDGPEQRGIAFDALREFEKVLGERAGSGAVKPKLVIIPTSRDRLLPALAEGHGEIAVGGFTVTEGRKHSVNFSEPTMRDVRHIIVTGPGAPPISSLDDLAGRDVHVRKSSSYFEDLTALNERFTREGKRPVVIVPVDELLEDEDILQMVDAGIIPITVTKTLYAAFWKQVYNQLTVHDDLTLRVGEAAWAIRRNTPLLTNVVNDFVRTHRVGTTFGNVTLKRYLGSAKRLNNPTSEQDLQRFRTAAAVFKKYGAQYEFDWLVIAAQSYQESRIDQNLKSSAGAVGVMQIKPSTAAEVGITNVSELENNVHAGVKYFRFLVDRYYKDEPMDRLNKGLFAFASYNAGPAKVRKLRVKAKEMGLDPNVWFNNVELVAGREIGRETVDYVSNIYKYYTAFKAVVAQQELRRQRTSRTR